MTDCKRYQLYYNLYYVHCLQIDAWRCRGSIAKAVPAAPSVKTEKKGTYYL